MPTKPKRPCRKSGCRDFDVDGCSKQAARRETSFKIGGSWNNQCQYQQITGGYPLYERGTDIKFVHERGEGDVHSSFDNHAAKGHNAGGDN